jgi:hypothetical protein
VFINEVVERPDGNLKNEFKARVDGVNQTLGMTADEFRAMGLPSRDTPDCAALGGGCSAWRPISARRTIRRPTALPSKDFAARRVNLEAGGRQDGQQPARQGANCLRRSAQRGPRRAERAWAGSRRWRGHLLPRRSPNAHGVLSRGDAARGFGLQRPPAVSDRFAAIAAAMGLGPGAADVEELV